MICLKRFVLLFTSDDVRMTLSEVSGQVSGSKIGFQCGIVGSGKALVFGGPDRRELVTRRLDATRLR